MSTISRNENIGMGSEGVSDQNVKRMHREIGAFLQAEVDRGDDKGLVEAGFQEDRIPEPSGQPAAEDPDEAEARAEAALQGEQAAGGEAKWTEHAARRYKQGEISAHQADLESGIAPDPKDLYIAEAVDDQAGRQSTA